MDGPSNLDESSQQSRPQAYILQNKIIHHRLLPAESQHSFVYFTFSLLLSLDALERQQLNLLGGWLFSYGGIWGRITGIRPSAYLHDNPRDKRSIKQKLEDILDERGFPGTELRDAWLMTMPSFLGYEGINPLSVYYCYRRGNNELWVVVLETHNTFGERHVDVLEIGENEDVPRKPGVDHQWKFPRQFHVSPFNDRSGHYRCQLTAPTHPPFSTKLHTLPPPPLPTVQLTLLTTAPPQVKLMAALRPTRAIPLSTPALLSALVRAPFNLLLTFPRILYNAFILHYHKRLCVYQRPEPCAFDLAVEAQLPAVRNAVQPTEGRRVGRMIGWQSEGVLEAWCRRRVYAFLSRRCVETETSITEVKFKDTLTIHYRSPRLFTVLFMMPSPDHAYLYGSEAEKIFSVSSKELFTTIFGTSPAASVDVSLFGRLAGGVRRSFVPVTLDVPCPSHHPLDDPMGFMPLFVLLMLRALASLERTIFTLLGARFVPGDEPWGGWERLQSSSQTSSREHLGSVRRGQFSAF